MNEPLISVIIPLFNHEAFLQETLNSVFDQTVHELEVILVDDGSTDDSLAVAKTFSDSRLHIYGQENRGAHAAINRGIELARGKYVAILNSDDIYDASRLEICRDFLENNPSVDAVFTELDCVDQQGGLLYRMHSRPLYDHAGRREHEDQIIAPDLLADNYLATTSNLFCRKEVFGSIGRFRGFRYCHDWDFFLRLAVRGHARIIRKVLLRYRIHDSNTISENKARVYFEKGVILADLFHNHDPSAWFVNKEPLFVASELYRCLRYHYVDRVMGVLCAMHLDDEQWQAMVERLISGEGKDYQDAAQELIGTFLFSEAYHAELQKENRSLREKLEALRRERTFTGNGLARMWRRFFRKEPVHRE